MYSSTVPSASVLDGVCGQHHAPAALLPVKARYPLYRRLSGPQGRFGRVWKNLAPNGIRSRDLPARSSVAIPTELSIICNTKGFYLELLESSPRRNTVFF